MTDSPKRELKRKPNRVVENIAEVHAMLDEGFIAHVDYVDPWRMIRFPSLQ